MAVLPVQVQAQVPPMYTTTSLVNTVSDWTMSQYLKRPYRFDAFLFSTINWATQGTAAFWPAPPMAVWKKPGRSVWKIVLCS